jgi:hypothetical protein
MYDQIRASSRFTALIRGYGADPPSLDSLRAAVFERADEIAAPSR